MSIIQYSVINYSHILYIRSSALRYLITLRVYTLLPTSPYSPQQPSSGNYFSTLYAWVWFLLRFYIYVIPCMICLCLAYFIQHNVLQVHSFCWKWQDLLFFFFEAWIIFFSVCLHVCITSLDPFIYWQIIRLFPHLSYCE